MLAPIPLPDPLSPPPSFPHAAAQALLDNRPLAFVDLETTGGATAHDRITEVGIVTVDASGVREWSSLVNPGVPIPPFIQSLTGITDRMVAQAPRFADIAAQVQARLAGALFVAHNVRFDHGFLLAEFERLSMPWQTELLCTVRLSRKLYPQHPRHNLDSLIARHGLSVAHRHRALDDARLLWQFWQVVRAEHPREDLAHAVEQLVRQLRRQKPRRTPPHEVKTPC